MFIVVATSATACRCQEQPHSGIIHGESNTVDRAFRELQFNVCYSKCNYIVLGAFESSFGFLQVVLRFSLLSIMIPRIGFSVWDSSSVKSPINFPSLVNCIFNVITNIGCSCKDSRGRGYSNLQQLHG